MANKNIDVYTLIKPEINKLKKIGIESASLDCRLLLSDTLIKNTKLYNHQNINISENEIKIFKNLIKERLAGQPISRILKKKNFLE